VDYGPVALEASAFDGIVPELASPAVRGFAAEVLPAARLREQHGDLAALAARSLEANAFLEPAFLTAALEGLGTKGGVELVTVRHEGRLVGALPITRGRGPLALRTARAWSHPYAVLYSPLIDSTCAAPALSALLEAIGRGAERCPLLLLPSMPAAGQMADLLAEVARRSRLPMVALDRHERAVLATDLDAEAYLVVALSAKRRKEYRRQRRRLAELGPVTFAVHREAGAVMDLTRSFLSLEASGWKGRRGTALLDRPAERAFFEAALGGLAAVGKVLAGELTVRGRPVAVGFVLLSAGRAFYWKTAYDETLSTLSPGVLMTLDLSQALIREGFGGFTDSCAAANHPMIDHLWRERRAVQDVMIAVDPRLPTAAFRAAVAAERARRALRARAKSAVHSIRRRLKQ